MTKKQRVLQLLYLARIEPNKPYLIHDSETMEGKVWISGGWRPVWYFVGIGRGGSAGYQRLWELQDQNNLPVEMKDHKWSYWDGKETVNMVTPIYRMNVTIEDIPFTNITDGIELEKFANWQFQLKVASGETYNLFN